MEIYLLEILCKCIQMIVKKFMMNKVMIYKKIKNELKSTKLKFMYNN